MEIGVEAHGPTVIIRPVGRVDSTTAPAFEAIVVKAIEGGARTLIIDLASLVYISSAGLRVVLLAGKRLRGSGGTLRLAGLATQIRDVFEISGLMPLFPVHDTACDALAAGTTGVAGPG